MTATFLDTMRRAIAPNDLAGRPEGSEAPAAGMSEKRSRERRRTRLRSGKVLDLSNQFIIECTVHDRSVRGARIRLPTSVRVPQTLRLYDDERRTLTTAAIAWRRNLELGLYYLREADESRITIAELDALARHYYAI